MCARFGCANIWSTTSYERKEQRSAMEPPSMTEKTGRTISRRTCSRRGTIDVPDSRYVGPKDTWEIGRLLFDDEEIPVEMALHGRIRICVRHVKFANLRQNDPLRQFGRAAPWFLLGALFVALGAVYFVNFVLDLCGLGNNTRIAVTAITAMMAIIPITLFLLRLIVYFRDGYRATTSCTTRPERPWREWPCRVWAGAARRWRVRPRRGRATRRRFRCGG